MSWTAGALVLAAVAGALSGALAPRVIARLPMPTPAPVLASAETVRPSPSGGAERADADEAVPSFGEIAESPGLAARLAVVGAVVGAVLGWRIGWTPALAPWTFLLGACLLLGYVDLRTRLLPTAVIRPAYVGVVLLLILTAVVDRSPNAALNAILGWVAMGGFYLVLWFVGPDGLGYGDVRLSGLLALCLGYLGWAALLTGLYAGFLIGGLISLALVAARRASRHSRLPFGPSMMLGALAGVIWGQSVAQWVSWR